MKGGKEKKGTKLKKMKERKFGGEKKKKSDKYEGGRISEQTAM